MGDLFQRRKYLFYLSRSLGFDPKRIFLLILWQPLVDLFIFVQFLNKPYVVLPKLLQVIENLNNWELGIFSEVRVDR
jgi:hypothetical protein